jgi:hypothetical protein
MAALACGGSLLLANSTIVHPDAKTTADTKADAKAPAEMASSTSATKLSPSTTPVSSKSDSAASTVLSATPTSSSTPLDAKIAASNPALNTTMRPMLDDKVTAATATTPVKSPAAQPKAETKPAETKPADSKPKEYLPAGPDLPTEVTIQTSGNSAAPIQRVEYSISTPFKTPARQSNKAKAGGIPVTFAESTFDGKAEKFSLSLTAPQVALLPNQPIPMAVQIVWPKYAGWTYRGKLTAYQAGQQPVTFENVEVDIVKTAAK